MNSSPRPKRKFSRWQTRRKAFVLGGVVCELDAEPGQAKGKIQETNSGPITEKENDGKPTKLESSKNGQVGPADEEIDNLSLTHANLGEHVPSSGHTKVGSKSSYENRSLRSRNLHENSLQHVSENERSSRNRSILETSVLQKNKKISKNAEEVTAQTSFCSSNRSLRSNVQETSNKSSKQNEQESIINKCTSDHSVLRTSSNDRETIQEREKAMPQKNNALSFTPQNLRPEDPIKRVSSSLQSNRDKTLDFENCVDVSTDKENVAKTSQRKRNLPSGSNTSAVSPPKCQKVETKGINGLPGSEEAVLSKSLRTKTKANRSQTNNSLNDGSVNNSRSLRDRNKLPTPESLQKSRQYPASMLAGRLKLLCTPATESKTSALSKKVKDQSEKKSKRSPKTSIPSEHVLQVNDIPSKSKAENEHSRKSIENISQKSLKLNNMAKLSDEHLDTEMNQVTKKDISKEKKRKIPSKHVANDAQSLTQTKEKIYKSSTMLDSSRRKSHSEPTDNLCKEPERGLRKSSYIEQSDNDADNSTHAKEQTANKMHFRKPVTKKGSPPLKSSTQKATPRKSPKNIDSSQISRPDNLRKRSLLSTSDDMLKQRQYPLEYYRFSQSLHSAKSNQSMKSQTKPPDASGSEAGKNTSKIVQKKRQLKEHDSSNHMSRKGLSSTKKGRKSSVAATSVSLGQKKLPVHSQHQRGDNKTLQFSEGRGWDQDSACSNFTFTEESRNSSSNRSKNGKIGMRASSKVAIRATGRKTTKVQFKVPKDGRRIESEHISPTERQACSPRRSPDQTGYAQSGDSSLNETVRSSQNSQKTVKPRNLTQQLNTVPEETQPKKKQQRAQSRSMLMWCGQTQRQASDVTALDVILEAAMDVEDRLRDEEDDPVAERVVYKVFKDFKKTVISLMSDSQELRDLRKDVLKQRKVRDKLRNELTQTLEAEASLQEEVNRQREPQREVIVEDWFRDLEHLLTLTESAQTG